MKKFVVAATLVATAGVASAHFSLVAPAVYSVQDDLGLPEKSAPCGQDDPGNPIVPTNDVTTVHAGDTITVTVDEKIFHPGHYRVALAQDMTSLPDDPAVTAGDTPCGSAAIQDSSTTGVIIDNQLPHTTAFSSPQSFQVTIPATTCNNCTLQVVEFMSDHGFNVPGGCFYHHCATMNVVAAGTAIPDGGISTPPAKSGGGCATASGSAGAAGAILMVGFASQLARRRRRRRGSETSTSSR
jgi:hypothetical protein|nr:SCE4755 family polysaccharide monooxygenase-like protein [Kofleriaceae bacterium]